MTVLSDVTSFSMNRLLQVALLAVFASLAPAHAQEGANLRGDSAQSRKRLTEAEKKLIAGHPADAIDELQRVLDESGDDFIAVDGKQYRTARSIVQGLLARIPVGALKAYRDRIDDPARQLLAAAKRTRDPAPLWQLLDRYFVSRPAEEGILLLGDLLFERGQFRAAERMWRRLLPDAGADIIYPGAQTDRAAVRARIVLAIVFQRDLDRARTELNDFKAKHASAVGTLANRTGPLAETLQGILDHPPGLSLPANSGMDWPTFAGGVDRSGRVAARLSGEWPARPTWERILPEAKRHSDLPFGQSARPPFCHPVIVDGHVFVTDARSSLVVRPHHRNSQWGAHSHRAARVRENSRSLPNIERVPRSALHSRWACQHQSAGKSKGG